MRQAVHQPRWDLVRQRRSVFELPRGISLPEPRGFPRASSSASRTYRFVSQPLTHDALQRDVGALFIFDPESLPVAVSEIELGHIAMQVALCAVLVDALHAALEDAEEAFDRVRVDLATALLAATVVDVLVVGNLGRRGALLL